MARIQRIHCGLSFICLLAVLFAGAVSAQAQTNRPNTILILDGSGSMWGKITDDHKVLIARKAITNSLRPLEDKLNFGLMAYGHRRRGSCNDIQLLQAPARLNTARITRLVRNVKPLGKTPIHNALAKAAPLLAETETGGDIILLTDGRENCRRNPCSLISKDYAAKNKIKVHVIAFAMTERDANSLRCLSENSGGRFLKASNREELETALTTTFNGALKGWQPPKTAVEEPPRRTRPLLELTAHLGENTPKLQNDLIWKLEKLTREKQPDEDIPPWNSEKPQPEFDLETGSYRITARYQDYQISKTIELATGDERQEKIIFNLAELEIPAGWGRPNSRSGFGKLLLKPKSDANDAASQAQLIKLGVKRRLMLVPSGAYQLTGIDNGKLQNWEIEAEAGKRTKLPIWTNNGRLRLTLKDSRTGRQLTKPLLRIYQSETPSGETREKLTEISRSTALNPQFDLIAGRYLLHLEDGLAKKWEEVIITSGETTSLDLTLERALLNINIKQESAAGWSAAFYRQENKKFIYAGTAVELNQPITLTPGTYRIIMHKGEQKNLLTNAIKLTAGKQRTLRFAATTTPVRFQISDREDPLSRHQIFWQLYEQKGGLIWQSTKPTPSVNLTKGRYVIHAEIGKDKYRRAIRIGSRGPATIDLKDHKQ